VQLTLSILGVHTDSSSLDGQAHRATITPFPLNATHLVLDDAVRPLPLDSLIRRPQDPLENIYVQQLASAGRVVNLGWTKRAFSLGKTETEGFEARLRWKERDLKELEEEEEVLVMRRVVQQENRMEVEEEEEDVPMEKEAVPHASTSSSVRPPKKARPLKARPPPPPPEKKPSPPKRKKPSWFYEEVVDDPPPTFHSAPPAQSPSPPSTSVTSLSPPPPFPPPRSRSPSRPDAEAVRVKKEPTSASLPRKERSNGKKAWTQVERAFLVESVATTTSPRDAFLMFRRRVSLFYIPPRTFNVVD
jgi:hypothetical protein